MSTGLTDYEKRRRMAAQAAQYQKEASKKIQKNTDNQEKKQAPEVQTTSTAKPAATQSNSTSAKTTKKANANSARTNKEPLGSYTNEAGKIVTPASPYGGGTTPRKELDPQIAWNHSNKAAQRLAQMYNETGVGNETLRKVANYSNPNMSDGSRIWGNCLWDSMTPGMQFAYAEEHPDLANNPEYMANLSASLNDPSSINYDPYANPNRGTNPALDYFGVNSIDDDWLNSNRYLLANLPLTSNGNPSSSVSKKWTKEQTDAFWYYKLFTARAETEKAKTQYNNLKADVQQQFNDFKLINGRNPTVDEYMKFIDTGKSEYSSLKAMDNSRNRIDTPGYDKGNIVWLNEPVNYNQDSMYGLYYALCNGTYNENTDLSKSSNDFYHNYRYDGHSTGTVSVGSNNVDVSGMSNDDIQKQKDYYRSTGNQQALKELMYAEQANYNPDVKDTYFSGEYKDAKFFADGHKKYDSIIRGMTTYDDDGTTMSVKKPPESASESEKAAYEFYQLSLQQPDTDELETNANDVLGLIKEYATAYPEDSFEDMMIEDGELDKYIKGHKVLKDYLDDPSKVKLCRPQFISMDMMKAAFNLCKQGVDISGYKDYTIVQKDGGAQDAVSGGVGTSTAEEKTPDTSGQGISLTGASGGNNPTTDVTGTNAEPVATQAPTSTPQAEAERASLPKDQNGNPTDEAVLQNAQDNAWNAHFQLDSFPKQFHDRLVQDGLITQERLDEYRAARSDPNNPGNMEALEGAFEKTGLSEEGKEEGTLTGEDLWDYHDALLGKYDELRMKEGKTEEETYLMNRLNFLCEEVAQQAIQASGGVPIRWEDVKKDTYWDESIHAYVYGVVPEEAKKPEVQGPVQQEQKSTTLKPELFGIASYYGTLDPAMGAIKVRLPGKRFFETEAYKRQVESGERNTYDIFTIKERQDYDQFLNDAIAIFQETKGVEGIQADGVQNMYDSEIITLQQQRDDAINTNGYDEKIVGQYEEQIKNLETERDRILNLYESRDDNAYKMIPDEEKAIWNRGDFGERQQDAAVAGVSWLLAKLATDVFHVPGAKKKNYEEFAAKAQKDYAPVLYDQTLDYLLKQGNLSLDDLKLFDEMPSVDIAQMSEDQINKYIGVANNTDHNSLSPTSDSSILSMDLAKAAIVSYVINSLGEKTYDELAEIIGESPLNTQAMYNQSMVSESAAGIDALTDYFFGKSKAASVLNGTFKEMEALNLNLKYNLQEGVIFDTADTFMTTVRAIYAAVARHQAVKTLGDDFTDNQLRSIDPIYDALCKAQKKVRYAKEATNVSTKELDFTGGLMDLIGSGAREAARMGIMGAASQGIIAGITKTGGLIGKLASKIPGLNRLGEVAGSSKFLGKLIAPMQSVGRRAAPVFSTPSYMLEAFGNAYDSPETKDKPVNTKVMYGLWGAFTSGIVEGKTDEWAMGLSKLAGKPFEKSIVSDLKAGAMKFINFTGKADSLKYIFEGAMGEGLEEIPQAVFDKYGKEWILGETDDRSIAQIAGETSSNALNSFATSLFSMTFMAIGHGGGNSSADFKTTNALNKFVNMMETKEGREELMSYMEEASDYLLEERVREEEKEAEASSNTTEVAPTKQAEKEPAPTPIESNAPAKTKEKETLQSVQTPEKNTSEPVETETDAEEPTATPEAVAEPAAESATAEQQTEVPHPEEPVTNEPTAPKAYEELTPQAREIVDLHHSTVEKVGEQAIENAAQAEAQEMLKNIPQPNDENSPESLAVKKAEAAENEVKAKIEEAEQQLSGIEQNRLDLLKACLDTGTSWESGKVKQSLFNLDQQAGSITGDLGKLREHFKELHNTIQEAIEKKKAAQEKTEKQVRDQAKAKFAGLDPQKVGQAIYDTFDRARDAFMGKSVDISEKQRKIVEPSIQNARTNSQNPQAKQYANTVTRDVQDAAIDVNTSRTTKEFYEAENKDDMSRSSERFTDETTPEYGEPFAGKLIEVSGRTYRRVKYAHVMDMKQNANMSEEESAKTRLSVFYRGLDNYAFQERHYLRNAEDKVELPKGYTLVGKAGNYLVVRNTMPVADRLREIDKEIEQHNKDIATFQNIMLSKTEPGEDGEEVEVTPGIEKLSEPDRQKALSYYSGLQSKMQAATQKKGDLTQYQEILEKQSSARYMIDTMRQTEKDMKLDAVKIYGKIKKQFGLDASQFTAKELSDALDKGGKQFDSIVKRLRAEARKAGKEQQKAFYSLIDDLNGTGKKLFKYAGTIAERAHTLSSEIFKMIEEKGTSLQQLDEMNLGGYSIFMKQDAKAYQGELNKAGSSLSEVEHIADFSSENDAIKYIDENITSQQYEPTDVETTYHVSESELWKYAPDEAEMLHTHGTMRSYEDFVSRVKEHVSHYAKENHLTEREEQELMDTYLFRSNLDKENKSYRTLLSNPKYTVLVQEQFMAGKGGEKNVGLQSVDDAMKILEIAWNRQNIDRNAKAKVTAGKITNRNDSAEQYHNPQFKYERSKYNSLPDAEKKNAGYYLHEGEIKYTYRDENGYTVTKSFGEWDEKTGDRHFISFEELLKKAEHIYVSTRCMSPESIRLEGTREDSTSKKNKKTQSRGEEHYIFCIEPNKGQGEMYSSYSEQAGESIEKATMNDVMHDYMQLYDNWLEVTKNKAASTKEKLASMYYVIIRKADAMTKRRNELYGQEKVTDEDRQKVYNLEKSVQFLNAMAAELRDISAYDLLMEVPNEVRKGSVTAEINKNGKAEADNNRKVKDKNGLVPSRLGEEFSNVFQKIVKTLFSEPVPKIDKESDEMKWLDPHRSKLGYDSKNAKSKPGPAANVDKAMGLVNTGNRNIEDGDQSLDDFERSCTYKGYDQDLMQLRTIADKIKSMTDLKEKRKAISEFNKLYSQVYANTWKERAVRGGNTLMNAYRNRLADINNEIEALRKKNLSPDAAIAAIQAKTDSKEEIEKKINILRRHMQMNGKKVEKQTKAQKIKYKQQPGEELTVDYEKNYQEAKKRLDDYQAQMDNDELDMEDQATYDMLERLESEANFHESRLRKHYGEQQKNYEQTNSTAEPQAQLPTATPEEAASMRDDYAAKQKAYSDFKAQMDNDESMFDVQENWDKLYALSKDVTNAAQKLYDYGLSINPENDQNTAQNPLSTEGIQTPSPDATEGKTTAANEETQPENTPQNEAESFLASDVSANEETSSDSRVDLIDLVIAPPEEAPAEQEVAEPEAPAEASDAEQTAGQSTAENTSTAQEQHVIQREENSAAKETAQEGPESKELKIIKGKQIQNIIDKKALKKLQDELEDMKKDTKATAVEIRDLAAKIKTMRRNMMMNGSEMVVTKDGLVYDGMKRKYVPFDEVQPIAPKQYPPEYHTSANGGMYETHPVLYASQKRSADDHNKFFAANIFKYQYEKQEAASKKGIINNPEDNTPTANQELPPRNPLHQDKDVPGGVTIDDYKVKNLNNSQDVTDAMLIRAKLRETIKEIQKQIDWMVKNKSKDKKANEKIDALIRQRDNYKRKATAIKEKVEASIFPSTMEIEEQLTKAKEYGSVEGRLYYEQGADVRKWQDSIGKLRISNLGTANRNGSKTVLSKKELANALKSLNPNLEKELQRNRIIADECFSEAYKLQQMYDAEHEVWAKISSEINEEEQTDYARDKRAERDSIWQHLCSLESQIANLESYAKAMYANSAYSFEKMLDPERESENDISAGGMLPNSVMDIVMAIADDQSKGKGSNPVAAMSKMFDHFGRVNEKFWGEYTPIINALFFDRVEDSNAKIARHMSQLIKEVESTGITSETSEIADKYGKHVISLQELQELRPDDWRTIADGVKKIQQIYNDIFPMIQDSYLSNGFDAPQYRKDYLPNFKKGAQTLLEAFKMYNENDSIPTKIAGLTGDFEPRKSFFANAMQRHGNETDYDILYAFRSYMSGAMRIIHQTNNIVRLRQFEQELRNMRDVLNPYDATVKNYNPDNKVTDDRTRLSHYATWLQEYTNLLSGKKSIFDRAQEHIDDRKFFGIMDKLISNRAMALTSYNISSAITNSQAILQAVSFDPVNATKAFISLLGGPKGFNGNDAYTAKSDFLTKRFANTKMDLTWIEKFQTAGYVPAEAVDWVAAQIVHRTYYLKGIQKGYAKDIAMREADRYAALTMATSNPGEKGNAYSSRTLKLFTMFTKEPINELFHMSSDINGKNNLYGGNKLKGGASTAFLAILYWLYNSIFNRDTATDPIGKTIEGVKNWDKEKSTLSNATGILWDVVTSGLPIDVTDGDVTNLPAIAGFSQLLDAIQYLPDHLGEYRAYDNAFKAAIQNFMPGGTALARGITGVQTLAKGYAETSSGNVKHPVDMNVWNAIAAPVLGASQTVEGRKYSKNGDKPLGSTQSDSLKAMTGSGIDSTEAFNNITGTAEAKASTSKAEDAKKRGNTDIQKEQETAAREQRKQITWPDGTPEWAMESREDPAMQKVLKYWQKYGDTAIMPKNVGDYIDLDGERMDVPPEDKAWFEEHYKKEFIRRMNKLPDDASKSAITKEANAIWSNSKKWYMNKKRGGE